MPGRKQESLLYVALDVEYIDFTTFKNIDDLAKETSRLVGGLRSAVYKPYCCKNGRAEIMQRLAPLDIEAVFHAYVGSH